MDKSIKGLISQIEQCLENPEWFDNVSVSQLVAKVYTETNVLFARLPSLLTKLPAHLKREYERLAKEIEQQETKANHLETLNMQNEMLRIISIALQKTSTLQREL
ncbi:MAG: hypothetical protein FWE16_00490 [Firmicutes bacterium]|nr:hypothetical protein [Bacillota bacterium]